MLYGTMKHRVELLGTSLTLEEGQRVQLTIPGRLPPHERWGKYFARPVNGAWADGVARGAEDSILIDRRFDVTLED